MTNIVFPDGIRYAGLEMELDTGSSEILLDEVTYEAFTDLIDGPVTKLAGMTGIPLQAYNEEDTLTIEIGGEPYTLAMGSLRSTGVPPGGDMNLIWLRVDEDVRSILGAPFFKEYYVHFDEANERVGVGRNI